MAATKQKPKTKSKGAFVKLKGLEGRVASVDKGFIREDHPAYEAGDTLKVHVRIREGEKERVQAFEGVVIGKSNRGGGKSFTVRKISHGVGVERIFLESSPKIAKIEVLHQGKVRRAKLYYLRKLEGKAARVERETNTASTRTKSAPTA